jgi:eukaryotic-like serine/threonine-protein kinase
VTRDAEQGESKPATSPFVAPGGEQRERAPIGLRVQGRYRIVSELGTGDFGAVCVAEDEATGHPVAIRLLPRGLAAAPQAGQAILRLGRSIVEASTAHRGLVRVLEFGEAENGRLFVAMELVEGRRLSEILSTEKPFDVRAALGLTLEIGGPLETLHNMGLVHGGLRPRNVMVLKDGRVKLMDVELIGVRDARALDGVINAEPPAEYLSPEQITRVPVTEKTDIYAFGVILYEMLCGVPPFRAATRAALLAKHQTETPLLLRRRRRAIPSAVEHIVMQALAKRPERRPLMPDLLNPLWAEAHGPTTRWRRTAAILAGAGVAASIAVIIGWSLFAAHVSETRQVARPVPPALTEPALPPVAPPALPAITLPAPPAVARPTPPPVAPPAPAAITPPAQVIARPTLPPVARPTPPPVAPPAPAAITPPAPPVVARPTPPPVAPPALPAITLPAPPAIARPTPPTLAQPALPPAQPAKVSPPPPPAALSPVRETRTAPAVVTPAPSVVTPARTTPPPAPQLAPPSPPKAVERAEPPRVSPPTPARAQVPEQQPLWSQVPAPEPARPPQARPAPAGAPVQRPPVSSETQTDDPGAVIDWLLKGSGRGQ